MDLHTTTLDADAPEFDWDADLSPELILNLAQLGDHDMRLRVAAHRSITDEAGLALLILGDRELGATLRKNINVSSRLFELAAKPRQVARAANRAERRQQKADRRDYLAFLAIIQTGEQK